MTINIYGEKYKFKIVIKGMHDVIFIIRAICKTTNRTSCINNLNAILSELDIPANDPKFFDSSWVLTKEEALTLTDRAKKFLSDKIFLKYLEQRLEEDREAGEWENIYR